MYLIAACLLALRPILRRMSPKEMRTKLQNKIALHGSHHSKSDTSHTSSDKTASVAMDWFKGREHRERSASEELVFPPAAYLNHPPSKSLDAEQGPVSSVYV